MRYTSSKVTDSVHSCANFCASGNLGRRSPSRHDFTVRGLTPTFNATSASVPMDRIIWLTVIMTTSVHDTCFFSTKNRHELLIALRRQPAHTICMDISKEIGRRIKASRNLKNRSLQTLSAHCQGLSKSRIGNYEQGIRRPGREEAIELSRALGISAAYLLCLDDDSTMTDQEKRLINTYRLADDRGKDTIMGTANTQSVYTVENPGRRKAS